MSKEDIIRLLAAAPVFAGLDEPTRTALASECRSRRFLRGEHIFTRGDVGGGMYVLAGGSVSLVVNGVDGDEVVLHTLRPPESFGEMSVVDGGARIASGVVREASVVVEVPRHAVLGLLDTQPSLARALLAAMAALVRRVDQHAADLVLLDLRGRVAKYLLDAASRSGQPASGEPVPVDIRLSQGEVARIVGGSRQQLNRILGELTAQGAVVRDGARVVAVRPEMLRHGTGGM